MLKVLFLTHRFYPDVGGIEVNSEILAVKFKEMGCRVKLFTWTSERGEKDFPFDVVRSPSTFDLYQAHRWADVVYENNPCLRMAWLNLLIRRPRVVALRTWISRTNGQIGWQDKLKLYWVSQATKVVAVSEAVGEKHGFPATVIGNPYRKDFFKVLPGVHRSLDFVFLGRLVSDKGANLAIEALAALCSEEGFSSLNLTIIGDGPDRLDLENLAKKLDVADRVTFAGPMQGEILVNALNQHKVILIPSLWEEPFGNVALEGMACGCIPIVSDGGGLPDAVGKAGLLFERGNVKALARSIKSLLADQDLQRQLIANAEAHLLNHRPDKVAAEYLKVIKEALKQKSI